jgi:hypothetical protein
MENFLIETMQRPFHITTVLFDVEGPLAAVAGSRRAPRALAKGMLAMLRARGLGMGVVSRHAHKAVLGLLKHRFQMRPADIRLCVTLDAPRAGSRRRNPFPAAARSMRTVPQRFMVVSADRDLLRLAKGAGAVAVEWCTKATLDSSGLVTDYRVSDLQQLSRLIRMGVPLPAGKLPNDLLKEFLDEFTFEDPALLINPGVGEDIAAVDVPGRRFGPEVGSITFAPCDRTYAVRSMPTTSPRPAPCPLSGDPSVPGRQHAVRFGASYLSWGILPHVGHHAVRRARDHRAVTRPVVWDDGQQCPQARSDQRRMRPGDRVLLTRRSRGRHCHHRRELGPRLRSSV